MAAGNLYLVAFKVNGVDEELKANEIEINRVEEELEANEVVALDAFKENVKFKIIIVNRYTSPS